MRRFPRCASSHALLALLLWGSPGVGGCGKSKAETAVSPGVVAAEYRDDWAAVERARATDPGGESVAAAADRLLQRSPPLRLQLAAIHAKAEQAEVAADDQAVADLAQDALSRIEAASTPAELEGIGVAFRRLHALALARSGDPALALTELAALESAKELELVELRAAQAMAFERRGEPANALLAYLGWREEAADGSADAAYAEERAAALAASLDREELAELARRVAGSDSGACLDALAGRRPAPGAGAWVQACRAPARRIGVLLPRSGRLAALADRQLAAASAASEVLAREHAVEVVWMDSGSTAETARLGALQLADRGVETIVGPVGAENVGAVAGAVTPQRLILPGETTGGAIGVAPSLGARVERLMAEAGRHAGGTVFVLAPDNAYGERALRSVRESRQLIGTNDLKIQSYPVSTTSFLPVLSPWLAALGKGAPLLVLDSIGRVEMIARQLRRSGVSTGGGKGGSRLLTTGEGAGAAGLGVGHEPLESLLIAPVAAPSAESREFEAAYLRREGEAPDDQALLVWEAMRAAWSGAPVASEPPRLVRVEGGRLVPVEAP